MYSNFQNFTSIDSIKNTILNEEVVKVKIVNSTKVTKIKQQKRKVQYENINDDKIKLIIQHNSEFLNFLMLVKKIKPFTTFHVENNSQLVFTLCSSEYFPIIFAKFNILSPSIQTNGIDDIWFNFPIGLVTNCIEKIDKSTSQYMLLIREIDSGLSLEYKSVLTGKTTVIGNLVKINRDATMQQMFYNNKINIYTEFEEDINQSINYFDLINNMEILMISECRDFGNFERVAGNIKLYLATQLLKIKGQDIILETKLNKQTQKNVLCSNESKIYFKDSFDVDVVMTVFPFTPLFKGVDKLKGKSNYSYFLLTKWKKYESGVTAFMIVKLLIDSKIIINDNVEILTFEELIVNKMVIYELFECYCKTESIETNLDLNEYY